MAAGGLDVLRRDSHSSFHPQKEEEVVPYRNSVRDAKYHSRDGGSNFGRDNERQSFSSRNHSGTRRGKPGSDDVPRCRNGEESKREDGIQLPPEKKRKFSPIIWDLEEKEVKVSLKNRIVKPTNNLLSLESPATSASERLNVASDGFVKKTVSESQVTGLESASAEPVVVTGSLGTKVSKSSAGLSPVLQKEHTLIDRLDLEEEEFVLAHNISTSRWATDSDSPRDSSPSYGEGTPERQEHASNRSTPESGEFLRESSEEDRSSLSGSDERRVQRHGEDESSENEVEDVDSMDIDGTPDEDAGESLQSEEPAARPQRSMLLGCRSVYEFEKLNKINEGTYGIVYRARDKKTGEIVALKKIKLNVGRKEDILEYGFPITSLREINILLSFNHPSIVNVKEVVMDDHDGVYMVMEYMEHDLKGLMESMKQPFSTSEVKCLMLQLLEGIKYLHDNWVLHRDLKTSNLLVDNQGQLKLCDFGMSRQYGSPLKPYTSLVVTLWYRAPELLLGAKKYSTALDMWSVGCIMAEFLAKKALFNGKNEVDQIDKIFRTLGTPNEKIWPGFSKLPGAKAKFVQQPYNLLRKKFPATSFTGSPVLSEAGFDLLNKLLTYDPDKRITAEDALNHEWFREVPLPKSKEFMPTFPPQHARKRHVQSTRKKKRELAVGESCSIDDGRCRRHRCDRPG